MRLIDVDKFEEKNAKVWEQCGREDCYYSVGYILSQASVDATLVIRCKDCKYYRDGDCWHEWDNAGRIYYQSVIDEPNPDDYCSKAERREE